MKSRMLNTRLKEDVFKEFELHCKTRLRMRKSDVIRMLVKALLEGRLSMKTTEEDRKQLEGSGGMRL